MAFRSSRGDGSDLQVPLDFADVVLQQEVVLQREAAVLVVQLSQQVVEADGGQRVLHRHRIPVGGGGVEQVSGASRDTKLRAPFCPPLPVDALDPLAQVLPDVHGEGVVVQLVHLLQVLTVQHLKLAPLRHLLGNERNCVRAQTNVNQAKHGRKNTKNNKINIDANKHNHFCSNFVQIYYFYENLQSKKRFFQETKGNSLKRNLSEPHILSKFQ